MIGVSLGRGCQAGVEVVEMPNYPRGLLNDPFVDVLADRLKAEIEKIGDGAQAARQHEESDERNPAVPFLHFDFHFIETECPALLGCCSVGGMIC